MGCDKVAPCPPFLYALTMEHLAIALQNNLTIKGITVDSIYTKLTIFADDLLLFVTQLHMSLPLILQEFKKFGVVSNFKVNYIKSQILNISLQRRFYNNFRPHFLLRPVTLPFAI